MRDLFLLNPGITFLNHGSFGATPRSVFEVYQAWQRQLEWQPVKFLGRDIGGYLADARRDLASYVNAAADDLVYVPNATHGVNVVARSLVLDEGDEVLGSTHEYGACDNVWQFMSRKRGFKYIRQSIALPLTTPEEIVEQFWAGVTPRTKVIFVSHVTSPTAVRLPIETICARAREVGILTVIDGAHAPGQIPLDLTAIDADYYCGNGHKWLMGPKGSAFLYARPSAQHLLEPLLVGWGWGEDRELTFGSDFLDYNQWPGTNDYAAYLSLPAAIRFQAEHNWATVIEQCHSLVIQFIRRMEEITGLPSVYPVDPGSFFRQMAIAPLPPNTDVKVL
jgi:isopenicillin-N epimerase